MPDRNRLFCLLYKVCPLPCKTIMTIADYLVEHGITVAPIECHCKDCQNGVDDAWPDGKLWCRKMCRYMAKDGYCSEGEKKGRC